MKKHVWLFLVLPLLAGCGEVETFSITRASDISGGSLTFSSAEATANSTVFVTVSTNDGFVFNELTSSVESLEFTEITEGVLYSFTMPEGDVVIDAEFDQYYSVSVESGILNGLVSVSAERALPGDTVTITTTPDLGYALESVRAGNLTVTAGANNTHTFVMPETNVSVGATFSANNYDVSVKSGILNGTLAVNKTTAIVGNEVTVDVTPATGYKLATITTTPSVAVSPVAVGSQYKFAMPANNVEVNATFEAIDYDVVVSSSIVGGSVTANVESANVGDTVTVNVAANNGYEFKSISAGDTTLTPVTEGSEYTFTMPAENVIINAEFEASFFTVSLGDASGGSVILSSDRSTKGSTVFVNVEPNEGNKFIRLTSEPAVNFKEIKAGSLYSFTMPEANIVVDAEFAQVRTIESVFNSNPWTFNLSLSGGEEFIAGEEVTLDITTASYYNSFSESQLPFLWLYVNDVPYNPTFPDASNNKLISVTFTMPDENVNLKFISATGGLSEEGFTITYVENENATLYGVNPDLKYEYVSPKVELTPGYKVTQVRYKENGSEDWIDYPTFYQDGTSMTLSFYLSNLSAGTTNITLEIIGNIYTFRSISYINSELINFYDKPVEMALPGDLISITSFSVLNSSQYLSSVTYLGLTDEDIENISTTSIKFTMPDNNVAISFNVKDKGVISFENNDVVSNTKSVDRYWWTDVSTASPGETLYISAKATEGYLINGLTINGEEVEETIDTSATYPNYRFTATMPEGDAEIGFVTEKGVTVTPLSDENGSVSLSRTTYKPGENVSFSVRANNNYYKLTNVVVSDSEGNDISDSVSLDLTAGTFIMPDKDVTIKPVFEEVDLVTVTIAALDSSLTDVSLNLRTTLSSQSLAAGQTYDRVILGEELTVSINASNKLNVKMIVTPTTGDAVEYTPDVYSYGAYYFNNNLKLDTSCSIEFVFSEKEAFKVTIDTELDITLSYKLNYTAYDSLDGLLYGGESVEININETPRDGYKWKIVVTDSDGNEITKDSYYKTYKINSDITITITEIEFYGLTINKNGIDAYVSFYYTPEGAYYPTYLYDGYEVPLGQTMNFSVVTYSSSTYYCKIVCGGEIVYNGEVTSTTYYGSFTTTGSIQVEFSTTPFETEQNLIQTEDADPEINFNWSKLI